MPKKIPEIAGKGSHTNWTHPYYFGKLTVSGQDSVDAKRYQEKDVNLAIQEVKQAIALEEDNCYLVGFPDFPGQKWRTHGDTYETAENNGVAALESLMLAYEASGETLPEPKTTAT